MLVSDIRMPGGATPNAGLELLQAAREKHPGLPVIIMTAFSDLESAVSAFQGGAFEYLPKPFDVDQAVELIRRAVDESLREAAIEEQIEATPEILGQAPAMQDVFRAIGRLSQSNVTVLITGESGTGKELVARALHRHSPRASQPFIALNTAAIPKELLESELFGHERGAFTGAQSMRRGRFEQAEGGSLFLDEIGDMPSELQTRLLRVLSDGHFYRVGGHSPMKANVRVIAATHQNLEDLVRQGSFREDLYHRLNVIRLRLPALHERAEDIPMLARNFLQKSARELGVDPKRLSDAAMKLLVTLPFPGNVRQLENLCHWLTVMAPAQVVEIKDLPPEMRGVAPEAARTTSLSRVPAADAPAACRCAAQRAGVGGVARGAGRRRRMARRARTDGRAPARARPARRDGRADAAVRGDADPHGAATHRRAPHRGGATARHRTQHDHAKDPGPRARRRALSVASSVATTDVGGRPSPYVATSATRERRDDRRGRQSSANVATTGAWSDGCFFFRSSRSIVHAVHAFAIDGDTSTWSIRRPRPFWKPSIR